jgi:hypothetical protein
VNNREREEWINNDEGLYRWWKAERMSITAFVKMFRKELDTEINKKMGR